MVTSDIIYEYMQDKQEYNILLDNKEQFSPVLIDTIIQMTYEKAKILAPAISNNPEKIPNFIIIHGVISGLLESESFKELRNQLQYQDNNMSSVPLSAKQQSYSQLSQVAHSNFVQMLNAYATSNFFSSAWGYEHSNSMDLDLYSNLGGIGGCTH